MTNKNTVFTPAWLMLGMTQSLPGILYYDGQHFGFETDDESHCIKCSLNELINIKYPWYYFGGGFKATANGKPFRISLVKPNGAEQVSKRVITKVGQLADNLGLESLGVISGLTTIIESVDSIREGRTAMKLWQDFFKNPS